MSERGQFTGNRASGLFNLRQFLSRWHDSGGTGQVSIEARLFVLAGTLCMVGILALHLGLLTRGAWGGDEYKTIGLFRDHGVPYLWWRFWSWSPRPVSETLISLYATAVIAARQPLIVPTLLMVWSFTIAAASFALFRCTRDNFMPRALSATAVLALIVLGPHVEAVFYWPIGAFAYAPVIAAFLFLLFFLVNEQTRGKAGGLAMTMALLVAAWSSEAGALLVLISAALMVPYLMIRDGRSRILMNWTAPVLASLFVVWLINTNNRPSYPMLPTGDTAIYHHAIASFRAAVMRFPLEFMALDGETFDRLHLVHGVAAKLLFFIGIHCCWMTTSPDARRARLLLPVFALAVMIATFAMLVASFRDFGGVCCGQHIFLRQSLGLIAVAAVAMWMPPLFTTFRSWHLAAAAIALVLAAFSLIHPRLHDIEEDYRYYAEPANARARTWASGFSAGPDMTLWQPYSDDLFPARIPPGLQVATDNWWAAGILGFFNKEAVTVLIAPERERD
jgi:hypothetical protein